MVSSLFAISLLFQVSGPVVGNAAFLAWDYSSSIEDEFRVYCNSSSGVVPTGAPTAVVPAGTTQWAISGLAGQQYCVVTAYDADSGVESIPSNEIPFFVFPAPSGLRVVVP